MTDVGHLILLNGITDVVTDVITDDVTDVVTDVVYRPDIDEHLMYPFHVLSYHAQVEIVLLTLDIISI